MLDGGEGDDSLIGDNSLIVAPIVDITSTVSYVNDNAREMNSEVINGRDLIGAITLIGGNDEIRGGAGDDLAVGDSNLLVAPIVSISQDVTFEEGDRKHKTSGKRHVSSVVHSDLIDDIVGDIFVIGGNDSLDGEGGNDRLIGDGNTIIAPSVSLTQNVSFADSKNHGSHEFTQDFGGIVSHDVVGRLVFQGGNDTVLGGDGDDHADGDDALLIAPVLDLEVNVVSAGDSHHKGHHGSDGTPFAVFNDIVQEVTMEGGNDTVQGGAGNDLLGGDNSINDADDPVAIAVAAELGLSTDGEDRREQDYLSECGSWHASTPRDGFEAW